MTIGLGTLTYGAAAGMSFAVALYFGAIRVRRQNEDPIFAPFALLGILGALCSLLTVGLHKSGSVDEYANYLKLFGLVSLLLLATIVALVAAWTAGVSRRAGIVFTAMTVIVGIVHLALPTGLLAGQITVLREVRLFDEPFVVHVAATTSWRPVLDVYLIATVALIVTTLARAHRRVSPQEMALISGSVIMVFVLGAYDSLVDAGAVDTTYLAPFAVVSFVAAGSVLIAGRMAGTEARLQRQAADLEWTVVDRTAALNRANDQLQRQLSRQRTTVRRLERLTRQFESVNQLALEAADANEMRDSLQSMLENLGRLLQVDAVELHVSSGNPTGQVPRSATWQAAGQPGEPAGKAGQPSEGAADGFEVTERIAIGRRGLGRLVIRPRSEGTYGAEERRFVSLAVEQLAGLIHRLELHDQIAANAVHGERSRIARELHDSVTQRLYAVTFLAEAVARLQVSRPDQVPATIRRMRELILSSLAELRVLLFELRPEGLDAAHLPELIEQLAETVGPRSDVQVDAMVEPIPHLPQEVVIGFYRIAQEAMSNAVRHSGSATVVVGLHHDDGTTTLTVSDVGVGFDPSRERTGHGLHGLRERASLLGVALEIRSEPGSGTDLVVQWPADTTAQSPPDVARDPTISGPDHLAGRGPT